MHPSTPFAQIKSRSEELTGFLKRLVSLRTVNPPGENYGEITALLTEEFSGLGLSVKRFPAPKSWMKKRLPAEQWAFPRYNVLGRWDVGAKKTIHFNAHYDVVPVDNCWTKTGPFEPAVIGGWLYGRGSSDMKGSIASLWMAIKTLRDAGLKPSCNVEFSFTADEETDSMLGAGWLVKEAPLKADYAVVMEGGEGDVVCCGHNGVVWLNVVVHGRAAHGSQPELGINALEKMSELVLALGAYKKQLARRKFVTPDGRTMTPTMNIGGVFASGEGGKINTVPSRASFSIDRRVVANEDLDSAEADLRAFLTKAAAGIPDCRITIEKVSDNYSCFTKPTDPFFKAMAESVGSVRKRPARFSVSTGFNDMHFFSHYLGIPTLGYGPGGVDYHAANERVKVKDLVECAAIYADLMMSFGAVVRK